MAPFVLLFLVLGVQARNRTDTDTTEPEPSSVPAPTHVRIESYNANPILYWEYPITVPTPVFSVQVKTYRVGIWTDVCMNISHHQCSIFNEIKDPSIPVWARVKAKLGQKESAYVESKEFIMCQNGKVGPPKLDVSKKENKIIIDIYDPSVIVNGKEMGIVSYYEDSCYSFIYNVHVRINGTETIEQQVTECNETQCQSSIPVPSVNSEYCVSAQGFADDWGVTTEKSKEHCITVSDSSSSYSVWIPVVSALLFFLALILIFLCCQIKKINKRKNITLPKSLVSVVKNATSETRPESKYVSCITSYQPIALENEMISEEFQATAPSMHAEGNAGEAEQAEEVSSEIAVVTTDENISDMAAAGSVTPVRSQSSLHSTSNQSEAGSVTLNLYHSRNGSDSGLVESDGCLSDLEFSPSNTTEIKTQRQDCVIPRNTTTSFGYDKPHVLVEVLVDDDRKESLIGYRLPADSKELS